MNTEADPYQSPSPEGNDAPVSDEKTQPQGSLFWGVIGIIIGCLCVFGSISGFVVNGFGVGAVGLLLNLAFGLFMLLSGGVTLSQYFNRKKNGGDG